MSRQPLIVCGLTRFAEMVAHYFETCSEYEVVAFAAHERFVTVAEFSGRRVIPIERLTQEFAPGAVRFFAALEYKWLNAAREQVIAEVQSLGYEPATFIHPASHVCPTARLGEHCLVMEGAVLSYGSVLGDDNILFPQTFVGQAARIGSHNYLCPGVVVDRFATVDDHCYLGAGTHVIERGEVGSWCYTRPRQVIVEPIAPGTTFNPALRAPGRVVDRRAKSLVATTCS